jgi:hypothetical protein
MDGERALNWWIRGFLLFAVVQGLGIGLTGLLVPPEMQIPLRISPLNTRFAAALYAGGGIGVLLAAFSKRRAEVRLFVIGFGFATGIILILTVLHWSDFMADPLPHRWVWIFDYVADPVLAIILVPLFGLMPPLKGVHHSLSPLLMVQAVVFGVLGVVMLVAPELASTYWPWALPAVLGQLYACLILTFAVGAFLASRETSQRAVRDFLIASLGLALLVLLASSLHLDRFKPDPVTPVWFVAWALAALSSAGGLVLQGRAMGWRSAAQPVAPA